MFFKVLQLSFKGHGLLTVVVIYLFAPNFKSSLFTKFLCQGTWSMDSRLTRIIQQMGHATQSEST